MRVFLSMQMSQLTREQYHLTWARAMELVSVLRRDNEVYFWNEDYPEPPEVSDESFDASDYLSRIAQADCFVAIVTERVCSSIYLEAGYALALRKRSAYYATRREVMPLLMRGIAHDDPEVKVVYAQSMDEIIPMVTRIVGNWSGHMRTGKHLQPT